MLETVIALVYGTIAQDSRTVTAESCSIQVAARRLKQTSTDIRLNICARA